MDVAREDEPTVECISEIDKVERVTPGPTQDHPRSTPVMLEPARPPAVVLRAKPKTTSKPASKEDVRDQTAARRLLQVGVC